MSTPEDDLARYLTIANADDPALPHIAVVGDTYTILVAGKDTKGRYSFIDMKVPFCGGPELHRHEFEEMFTVLKGGIEVTFRGKKYAAKAGTTANIPANAPHHFKNVSGQPARMLCMCSPAGQEEFFGAIGTPSRVETRPLLN